MAVLSKIAFKLGGKRLSAAQKKALAKAIRASALKRSRRASYKATRLAARKTKRFATSRKRVMRLTNRVSRLRPRYEASARLTQQAGLKRLVLQDKLKNPSLAKRALGLHNPKKAAAAFRRADRDFIRASRVSEQQLARLEKYTRKMAKISRNDVRFNKAIDRKIARATKTATLQLNQAKGYAQIAGLPISPADVGMKQAKLDRSARYFNATFYGLVGAQAGVTTYAYQKQKRKNKSKT